MLIWTARFSKKKAVCTVIHCRACHGTFNRSHRPYARFRASSAARADYNEERVSYLDSLGWQVAPGACGNTAVPAACSAGRYVSGL